MKLVTLATTGRNDHSRTLKQKVIPGYHDYQSSLGTLLCPETDPADGAWIVNCSCDSRPIWSGMLSGGEHTRTHRLDPVRCLVPPVPAF